MRYFCYHVDMSDKSKKLGNYGEDLASNFLNKKGYKILKRNYRTRIGEIDILAQDKDELVIVEVKTKTRNIQGSAEEMVNYFKQKKLINLAKELQSENENITIRIDVIAIDVKDKNSPRINHIKHAVNLL